MIQKFLFLVIAAGTFLAACSKKGDDATLQFDGPTNEVSGEWVMNGVTPTPNEPRSAIIPKYQFGTNMRYTHTSGFAIAPKTETGEYLLIQRPPIGLYVLVMKPDNGAEYQIELRMQPDNSAMFGALLYFKRR